MRLTAHTEYATFSSLSVQVQIYPQYHHSKFRLLTLFTFRWLTVTQRRRGFTFVHRIGLCLVCRSGEADPLDISPSASHPAVTSDACEGGNRPEHWLGAVLPAHSQEATSCRTRISV